MRVGNKPVGVKLKPPAFGPLAAEVRRRRKPTPWRTGPLVLMIVVLAAIGGSATIAARTWPNAFSLNAMFSMTAAKKPEPAPQKQVGHIIVTRSNSGRCDHY